MPCEWIDMPQPGLELPSVRDWGTGDGFEYPENGTRDEGARQTQEGVRLDLPEDGTAGQSSHMLWEGRSDLAAVGLVFGLMVFRRS